MWALGLVALLGSMAMGIVANDKPGATATLFGVVGSVTFFVMAVMLFQGVDFVTTIGFERL